MHAVESGKDLQQRLMIAFGGNGPLHATRVARRAQVDRILIPRDPGVGSAVGFLFAPVSFEIVRSRHETLETLDVHAISTFLDQMTQEAEEVVRSGAPNSELVMRRQAFMRYHGQGHEIEITLPGRALCDADIDHLQRAFEEHYSQQFSRAVPGMRIEILNWAVEVASVRHDTEGCSMPRHVTRAKPTDQRNIFCDVTGQWRSADVFDRNCLRPGDKLTGPALIIEPQTTTLVSADFDATVDDAGNIWLDRQTGRQ